MAVRGRFGSGTQRFQNRGETSALRSISSIATLTNLINCSGPHILTASPVSDGPLCKRMKADRAGGHHGPEFSIPKILYPEWQAEYQAALLELDPKRLFERVTAAETAIFNRLQAMSHNSDGHAERQAIEDALAALRVLKRDNLGYPDWEKK